MDSNTQATEQWFQENMPSRTAETITQESIPGGTMGNPTRPFIVSELDEWYLDHVDALPTNTGAQKARRTRLQKRGLKARF